MKLSLRVGTTITDLTRYHRVSVEEVKSRASRVSRRYLVGVMQSGKTIAIYSLRLDVSAEEVMNALEAAIGSGRTLCVLNRELLPLETDPHAERVLIEHNAEQDDETKKIERPYTLAEPRRENHG